MGRHSWDRVAFFAGSLRNKNLGLATGRVLPDLENSTNSRLLPTRPAALAALIQSEIMMLVSQAYLLSGGHLTLPLRIIVHRLPDHGQFGQVTFGKVARSLPASKF